MKFKILDSSIIFSGKVFEVIRRSIQYPDGRIAKFDLIEHIGAVTILPIDDQGNVYFVRQYRPAVGGMLLEIPAGTLEEGEAPEVCAQREIQEEVGMAAKNLELIGEFFLVPGYSTEYQYIYLATDLSPSKLPGDPDEYLFVEKLPLKQVMQMIREGQIKDGKTLAAFALAWPLLEQFVV